VLIERVTRAFNANDIDGRMLSHMTKVPTPQPMLSFLLQPMFRFLLLHHPLQGGHSTRARLV
jgi:hypothetical protein